MDIHSPLRLWNKSRDRLATMRVKKRESNKIKLTLFIVLYKSVISSMMLFVMFNMTDLIEYCQPGLTK